MLQDLQTGVTPVAEFIDPLRELKPAYSKESMNSATGVVVCSTAEQMAQRMRLHG
jgi:hypothetical protein